MDVETVSILMRMMIIVQMGKVAALRLLMPSSAHRGYLK
jgi:hypothetical protein